LSAVATGFSGAPFSAVGFAVAGFSATFAGAASAFGAADSAGAAAFFLLVFGFFASSAMIFSYPS
jgi:hypothetical protein